MNPSLVRSVNRRFGGRGLRLRRGFSLVEMLVAIAALSLIAIGLAQIFSATATTLRVGRRVSHLNEYAAMIERQLRRDVAAISADGFLLIRHRLADDGSPIPSSALNDRNARERRVDELVFFQEGQFSSIRDPVNPVRQASGPAARIYIGHGLRWDPSSADFGRAPRVDRPRGAVATDMVPAPAFGRSGPNQFAGDWILLRHALVLSGPEQTGRKSPLLTGTDTFPDSAIQVGWQPAVSSLFLWEAESLPTALPPAGSLVRGGPVGLPVLASGVVDVATTDLTEIRSTIVDARPPRAAGIRNIAASIQADLEEDEDILGAQIEGVAFRWSPPSAAGTLGNPEYRAAVRAMQAWMVDALPAASDLGSLNGQERRVRSEPVPPDYLGSIGASGVQGQAFADTQSWRRTDQTMLTASNFVPGCSEFIVEWSFGHVYPDDDADRRGQLIWHGMRRESSDGGRVLPYLDDSVSSNPLIAAQRRILAIPSIRGGLQPFAYRVPRELIHYTPRGFNAQRTLYSCFGYIDPFWPYHDAAGNPTSDANVRAQIMSLYGQSIPWAWPRLLRITMTLADPNDPNLEQTYQFVLEVPERSGRTAN
ncbi:MAG: prepilin-type N-terminal cleavage/methylation domain-containing protein [Phycisphaeraceae bacterium]|nr:prepilin-type N-terminal cleavage/methylation domain-containing protein [Phycisphaeraceae bacterium]